MNYVTSDRKWCEEHPDFLIKYLDTLPSSKVVGTIMDFHKRTLTEEERKSTSGIAAMTAIMMLYVQQRKKAEEEGTFQLKPPLLDDEVPPYLRRRIPCSRRCGQTFRVDTTLRRTTDDTIAPNVTPKVTTLTDDRGVKRQCARVQCSVCDRIYRAADYTVEMVHEAIRKGDFKSQRRSFERWLKLLEEEQVEERGLAGATTATVTLGRELPRDQPVTVTAEEMCSGTYVLGTQGAGKSSLLEHLALQRLEQSDSVMVIDPHGQLVDSIIARMPQERVADTYLLDLADARRFPFRLNIFHCTDPSDETERARTRGRVFRVFRRIWPEIESGQYAEKILRYVTNTLIYNPDCTLVDVPDWFRRPGAVGPALRNVQDGDTRAFWEYDLSSLSPRERSIQTEPFLNRLGRLLAEDVLRRLLCNPGPPLDVGQLVRKRRSLLVKLPVDSDVIGEAAGLVGVTLFSLIYAATFDERGKDWRDNYTLIVDEFQNFVTSEFVKLFVGGRKYGAKLVLAHQYTNQLDQPGLDMNRRGVLTARNVVSFHTTPHDATEVAPLFAPLEKTWGRDNLVADVADALGRHPVEAVKKFALRHVQPLIQASSHSRNGSADFGWGEVSYYSPLKIRHALALLNEFLYEAERDGRVSASKKEAFIEAVYSADCFPYGERDAAKVRLDVDLSSVTVALIDEPILERQLATGAKEVVTLLPALPSRTAFVKAGERTYQMETYPLPGKVEQHPAQQREEALIEQTRREYCSTRDTVDERIATSPCRRPPAHEPTKQLSEQPRDSKKESKSPPISRRSPKR
ncbi:hypothetical protein ABZ281_04145 [Streptomyces sp. NPDC006265]|uniref:type IV secretory system conjugative DNA transfer family protein n=1 Tax=Streptomyces sp. NPDC006265 TaxID=3156740 RepID=UPI0033B8318A